MSKNEIQNITYSCSKAGRSVLITLEYYNLQNYRELVSFHCDRCHDCGVGKEDRPGSWSFKWSLCEHPQAPKN